MSPRAEKAISKHIIKNTSSHNLYNQSFLTGIILDETKLALVTPV